MLKVVFLFINDTATTEIYTLSLHDALAISARSPRSAGSRRTGWRTGWPRQRWPTSWTRRPCAASGAPGRSEEHTSELQSRQYLVCRLLLEKKTMQIRKQFNLYLLNAVIPYR